MLFVIAAAAAAAKGVWTETNGLVFTFVVLMPALAIGLLIVASVASRGEKRADEEMLGRWGRKRRQPPEE